MSVFQFQLPILCYFSGWTPVPGTILESPFTSFQVLDEAIELRGKIKVDWSNTSGWKGHQQFFKTQDVSSVYKTGIQHEAELDFQSMSFRFQVGIATAIFIGGLAHYPSLVHLAGCRDWKGKPRTGEHGQHGGMAWDGQFEVVCSLGPEEPKSCVGPGLLRLLNRSMAGEDSTPPSSIPVLL